MVVFTDCRGRGGWYNGFGLCVKETKENHFFARFVITLHVKTQLVKVRTVRQAGSFYLTTDNMENGF